MKIRKPLVIRTTFLILGLIILTASAFKTDTNETKAIDTNCINPSVLVTVLTLEELLIKQTSSNSNLQVPFIGNQFIGFREAVGFKESRNRYHIVNKFGYLGKYQFGKSTLKRLKIHNVENFLKNPEQQEKAFKALCSLNKHILKKDIKRSVGKKINGVRITESGILAAAHLSGAGNVRKFLRSNGTVNFNDAFGTTIQHYIIQFSGYDVSEIEASKNPTI
ncbi:MAG: peptidoglycan-binding protein LysM [Flavobacteriaceae bacterium]|nr:peptidoglycan-binding protein LysM [Flavobacteriaceae bacterium]